MKKIFYLLVIYSSMSFAQNLTYNFKKIEFAIPENTYTPVNQSIINEMQNNHLGKEVKEIYEKIILKFDSRNTFAFRNIKCSCLNTFVLGQVEFVFDGNNREYNENSKKNSEMINFLKLSREAGIKYMNNSKVATVISYEQPQYIKLDGKNIFLMKFELIYSHNDKHAIAQTYLIPHNNLLYTLEFSSDIKNSTEVNKIIQNIINSIKISD